MESNEAVMKKDFPWFDVINGVLKNRTVTNPPHLVDTIVVVPPSNIIDVPDDFGSDFGEDEELVSISLKNAQASTSGLTSDNSIVLSGEDTPVSSVTPVSNVTPVSSVKGNETPVSSVKGNETPVPSVEGDETTCGPSVSNGVGKGKRKATGKQKIVEPPKKYRKMSTIDRAEKGAIDVMETVLNRMDEQRKGFEAMELERLRREEEKAKEDAKRDDRIMDLIGQFLSYTWPPPIYYGNPPPMHYRLAGPPLMPYTTTGPPPPHPPGQAAGPPCTSMCARNPVRVTIHCG
jgi:hypothetical protein